MPKNPNDEPNLPAKRQDFLSRVRNSKVVSPKASPSSSSPVEKDVLRKALASDRKPRLLFSMDATASREPSWLIAQQITGEMFAAVPQELDVALAYHGGGKMKRLTPFSDSPHEFQDMLLGVQCEAGLTALNEILQRAATIERLKALIYVGDCFEEDRVTAEYLSRELRLKGVRCFIFHDTSSHIYALDLQDAERAFRSIAEITGGAVLPFDERSPDLVRELLRAIAVYAARGIKALKEQSRALPSARILLDQIDRDG